MVKEADRLAILRAWTKAEPLFAEAERIFRERGDKRNELQCLCGKLRGELPRWSVAEMSERLAGILEDPIVQADERLKLRCLAVKGDTDLDFNPALGEQDWQEARAIATKLGDALWQNRADGELAIVAGLHGRTNDMVKGLGDTIQKAHATGDFSSEIRWLTIFGQGHTHFGLAETALAYMDKALALAEKNPDLQFPLPTYVGKAGALVKLKRTAEAKTLLNKALAAAREIGSLGYQAELLRELGTVAAMEGDRPAAIKQLLEAADLANKAAGQRLLLDINLELARIHRESNDHPAAERTLTESVEIGRQIGERFLLPRVLSRLAEFKDYAEASELLDEASDLLEGVLANVGSPWTKGTLIRTMDEVFQARLKLEGATQRDPARMFAILEQARGRAVSDLLFGRSLAEGKKRPDLVAGEKRLTALQIQLYKAKTRAQRKRILDDIFNTEQTFGAGFVELYQTLTPRKALELSELQRVLQPDEVFVEYALADPASYVLAVTKTAAKTHALPARRQLRQQAAELLKSINSGTEINASAATFGLAIPEITAKRRLIIAADDDFHRVPFDVLTNQSGAMLLESHAITKVPSGTVLVLLRDRRAKAGSRTVLALGAPALDSPRPNDLRAAAGVTRGVYDLDGTALAPLPSANDEARTVSKILGGRALVEELATEAQFKREPVGEYRVLHFAAHGLTSTKFPERSALMLIADRKASEDGLLQAREIISLRLNADLVTLSACDTGTGMVQGQEGVSTLVRPFLAAGARAVLANLWQADDNFSLSLMTEFYQGLASGLDKATALQKAKRELIRKFGAQAPPKLWAGAELHGDGRGSIVARR